jgi:hypothetical protein
VGNRPRWLLAAVCAVHAIAPLVLIGPHFWFEWDETVNISQVSGHAPAGLFTAPRARGMPVLLFPVTELTYSTAALRIYLALLSSIGLYLAFRPWLRLQPTGVVPLAAAVFSTLWVGIYYGFEAMPNFYVAIGAVAATAHLLLAVQDPGRRRHLLAVAAWLAFLALMRPSDATYVGVALVLSALLLRGSTLMTRLQTVAAVVVGLVLGWLEWVVEAFVSYGGLVNRLQAASAENHGGLHMSLALEARAVAGPTLCRPCTRAVPWPAVAWWLLVPPLVVLGVWSLRGPLRRLAVVPTVAALCILAEYVVTIDYAAPRFLLPTYALLSLPMASGITALAGFRLRLRSWPRRAFAPALAVVLLAHVAVQLTVLERAIVPQQTRDRLQYLGVARDLTIHDLRRPCLVVGFFAAPIAFAAGCSDTPTLTHRTKLLHAITDGRTDVAVLTPQPAPDTAFYTQWPRHIATGKHVDHPWFVYIRLRHTSTG